MADKKLQWRNLIMRLFVCIIMSVVVFSSWTEETFAADGVSDGDEANRPMIPIRLSVEQTEGATIDGSSASIGYTEFSAELEWQFLFFDIDHRKYEWKNSKSFIYVPGNDPWETLTRIAPGLQYYHKFGNKWGIWPKLVAISGFENKVSSRSWTYNPQVIAFYIPTQRMTIYGGLGMLYHTVDLEVYPVFGVALNMESKTGFSAAVGFPETMARYGFNKKLALKADFQYDIRYYQLSEDNNFNSKGYLKIEDLVPNLQVEYEPIKRLTLCCGVRWHFGRKLTIFDYKENELSSNDLHESFSYLLKVDYQF